MGPVEIHLSREVDLRGATIIDGFPSVGLVSTICANYLIQVLSLSEIGILDSPRFPTVSIVRGGVPMFPVRVYGGQGVVVFVSEFQPEKELVRPIAESLLAFRAQHGCDLVVSPEGLVTETPGEDLQVYGIGSTDAVRKTLEKQGLATFKDGIISGVSGVLMALGTKAEVPVVTLLAEASANYPDARAAARILEVISNLLPQISIDVKPLITTAEGIEETLKKMQRQAQVTRGTGTGGPSMYG